MPPPEIKSVIDRTATFVARSANPPQFEDKIREGQRHDPKFSFLNPADPYHAYYRHKIVKVTQGDPEEAAAPVGGTPNDAAAAAAAAAAEEPKKVEDLGVEPPHPDFILELPAISAQDLDIMKLTALFTAKRGRSFLAALSAREGRNYQFDFLRPNHSLFGHFNRLVDQYTKLLYPSKGLQETWKERAKPEAKWKTLESARQYAKWEKHRREREQRRQDDQEAERLAFAEIDWHDYAIVQTIEFTAADAHTELPAPMSVQEVENMTLAQKRMAATIMETTMDDVEAHRARQAAAESEAATAVGTAGARDEEDDTMMEESDNEEDDSDRKKKDEENRLREIERAKALQASALNAAGPMKIRTDYVPKFGAKNAKPAMTTCSICSQQVPVDELQEHMRIELLDPRWKSQRDALEARTAQASELQKGANVVASLKNLARTRVDIFGAEADEERRKKEEEEERERRKEREKVVWDGHTASKENTLNKYSTNVNFDEQIAAIHRAKGLGPQEASAIGPGIGTAAAPLPLSSLPPAPSSLPPVPAQASGAYAAATVSSGPQPASAYPPPQAQMLPPLHYQGLDAAQPFGYQPPPPGAGGMHPSRMAVLQAGGPPPAGSPMGAGSGSGPPPTGTVRSADQMEGEDGGPPAKKQKVAKLPGGQLYPEEDWINMHPYTISLQIQLPEDNSKPEWKLDGTTITLTDLPMNLFVSTLRDRIIQKTGSTIPASKIRLSHSGKMLANATSMASHNLEDEDLLVFSVPNQKKK